MELREKDAFLRQVAGRVGRDVRSDSASAVLSWQSWTTNGGAQWWI